MSLETIYFTVKALPNGSLELEHFEDFAPDHDSSKVTTLDLPQVGLVVKLLWLDDVNRAAVPFIAESILDTVYGMIFKSVMGFGSL